MLSAESIYRNVPVWLQNLLLNAHGTRLYVHRYGRRLTKAVHQLSEYERADSAIIEAYQAERIRAVVGHAAVRSPYYCRLWKRLGIDPSTIRRVEDLSQLPIITKEDVREHGASMLSVGNSKRGWLHGHTSGTTGSPLSLWYDRQTAIMTNAVDAQQKSWGGVRRGDWIGVILGRVVVPIENTQPPFWRINYVQRQVWFSAFHLNDASIPLYVQEIRRRKLRFLEGYPSTLYILAKDLLSRGQTLQLTAVFSSSETLHVTQKDAIQAAFQCPVYDFYGHAERVIFAAECECREGKHLAETFGVTEVVDAEGNRLPDGDVGYLVGTSLHNLAMPLIRYRTGDLSSIIQTPCSCGRTMRRIQNVTTKAEDIVTTADGRFVSPSVLTHPFKPFDQIRQSQVIQESLTSLRVRLVADQSFTSEHQQQLVQSLRDRLGSAMEISIDFVDTIPRENSGKFRWVISHVKTPHQIIWEEPTDDIDGATVPVGH